MAARSLNISQGQVNRNAVNVITKLKDAGFQALLVGGCVRDLLLGAHPKDFDVATSATPEQVRRLFRRSRMVGRRFKIAHVRYGRDLIEVSTFRRAPAQGHKANAKAPGAILRDNAYGTLDQDAFRRDFTVNALYYDPHAEQILDYVHGIEDIRQRRLRLIGQPRERLLEDPVRLLRAIRFQAKLGFSLDPAVAEEVPDTAVRLRHIPPARLFDEFSKMFLAGHAEKTWRLLERTPIPKTLFPAAPADDPLIRLAMANTDRRVALGHPVTPGFLLATLLWQDYQDRASALSTPDGAKMSNSDVAMAAAQAALADQRRIIALPRRHAHFITDVWHQQRHLQERLPKRVPKTLQHPKFRASYDFLLLQAQAGLVNEQLADWWTEIQQVPQSTQEKMIAALGKPNKANNQGAKRRRRRKRKQPQQLDAKPEADVS